MGWLPRIGGRGGGRPCRDRASLAAVTVRRCGGLVSRVLPAVASPGAAALRPLTTVAAAAAAPGGTGRGDPPRGRPRREPPMLIPPDEDGTTLSVTQASAAAAAARASDAATAAAEAKAVANAARSAALRARWADPVFRARMASRRVRGPGRSPSRRPRRDPNAPRRPVGRPRGPAREAKAAAPTMTAEERRAASSDRMKRLWATAAFRERVTAARRAAVARQSASLAARWATPAFRSRMATVHARRAATATVAAAAAAATGLPPPRRRAVTWSLSALTRARMSAAASGKKRSLETRARMSAAKLNRPEADLWPLRLSAAKVGKTTEYRRALRQMRALHADLRLWSANHVARTGRLPRASQVDALGLPPALVTKIETYLTLKSVLAQYDVQEEDTIESAEMLVRYDMVGDQGEERVRGQ
ncbi:hypothetical protein MMPV_002710 [Pyropia vietnamensis]